MSGHPDGQGMLKAYRFTLQMPACVTICATGLVEPCVNGQPTVSTQAKLLADRVRPDALGLAGLGDVVAEAMQIIR